MGRPLDGIALQTFFRNFNFSPERQERLERRSSNAISGDRALKADAH